MKARLRHSEAPSEPQHFHFQHCSCRMNIFYEVLGGRCTGWSVDVTQGAVVVGQAQGVTRYKDSVQWFGKEGKAR